MGYNVYKTYQRFSFKNYRYKALETVTITKKNKSDVLNYHQAIENLNGYIITQWSANSIDVRNPKDDDAATQAAVNEYGNKLANVKYYETILSNPIPSKAQVSDASKRNRLLRQLLSEPNSIQFGKSSSAIYELQKLLKAKGFDIPVDGYYRIKTLNALKIFEQDHGLYPDGKMDVLTLQALFPE
ncbi:hypothetical protein MHTCC0001_13100 [Flavobacteriaceae bacterium MHTCC 0001]